jgi:hypothetical protein
MSTSTFRIVLVAALALVPRPAAAEIADKVVGPDFMLLLTGGLFAIALWIALETWPVAAFALYPINAFLTWLTIDFLTDDLAPQMFVEFGWFYIIGGYAALALAAGGPLLAFGIARHCAQRAARTAPPPASR